MKFESTKPDDDDLDRAARAEVAEILGRSVPIRASTLAEAVAEAEKIKANENILLAINSLWAWVNALPEKERKAIGQFKNGRHFWMTGIFQYRRKSS